MMPTRGRVIVKTLPRIDTEDGFTLPDDKKNNWGIVVELGDPEPNLFNAAELQAWKELGVHPCPFRPGDKVLMPNMTGRSFEKDGDTVYVYWQSEIEVYE